jgi:FMN reductase
MNDIITIAGSPSRVAKSSRVLGYARATMEAKGWRVETIAVCDLPAEDLLYARLDSPAIQSAHALLAGAQAVIVATPIYKAAYSGVLKAFLDLLPQDALRGKIVLPLATGGSLAHLLAIDYALKPVLGALGATHVLRGVYLLDSHLLAGPEGELQLEAGLEQRMQEALNELHFQLKAQCRL